MPGIYGQVRIDRAEVFQREVLKYSESLIWVDIFVENKNSISGSEWY